MDATDDHQKHRPRFASLGTTYISLLPDGEWPGSGSLPRTLLFLGSKKLRYKACMYSYLWSELQALALRLCGRNCHDPPSDPEPLPVW